MYLFACATDPYLLPDDVPSCLASTSEHGELEWRQLPPVSPPDARPIFFIAIHHDAILSWTSTDFVINSSFMESVACQNGLVNAVYFPNWRLYRKETPAKLPTAHITHVLYAFIKVNTDGSLKLIDEYADNSVPADGVKGGLEAMAKLRTTAPHIRTLISVGGGGSCAEFPEMTASPTARSRFASEIRAFVDRYRFNGVDIDWEHPHNPKEGEDYVSLLEDIRQQMPSGSYLLTTALPPGQYVLRNINLGRAQALLDYINLMCYDLTGPWTEVSGNHAQLQAPSTLACKDPILKVACADGISYLTSNGFPSRKILLGIPAYARTFPHARGPGQSTQGSGEIDYKELPDDYVDGANVDDTAVAAWYVDSKNGFTTFDVPRTVATKAHYARSKSLGGLFYWTGTADRPGRQSLVQAGFEALNGRSW